MQKRMRRDCQGMQSREMRSEMNAKGILAKGQASSRTERTGVHAWGRNHRVHGVVSAKEAHSNQQSALIATQMLSDRLSCSLSHWIQWKSAELTDSY